jgi:hypothetical protein
MFDIRRDPAHNERSRGPIQAAPLYWNSYQLLNHYCKEAQVEIGKRFAAAFLKLTEVKSPKEIKK